VTAVAREGVTPIGDVTRLFAEDAAGAQRAALRGLDAGTDPPGRRRRGLGDLVVLASVECSAEVGVLVARAAH
jgi:hypothetical protein